MISLWLSIIPSQVLLFFSGGRWKKREHLSGLRAQRSVEYCQAYKYGMSGMIARPPDKEDTHHYHHHHHHPARSHSATCDWRLNRLVIRICRPSASTIVRSSAVSGAGRQRTCHCSANAGRASFAYQWMISGVDSGASLSACMK